MTRQGRCWFTTFYELRSTNSSRGSTLLDAVVGTALMLVVFVGIVGAFRLSIMPVSNNKARPGAIPETETVSLNNVSYTRRTFVSYEDDPGDGLAGADSNGIVTDFKAVK